MTDIEWNDVHSQLCDSYGVGIVKLLVDGYNITLITEKSFIYAIIQYINIEENKKYQKFIKEMKQKYGEEILNDLPEEICTKKISPVETVYYISSMILAISYLFTLN